MDIKYTSFSGGGRLRTVAHSLLLQPALAVYLETDCVEPSRITRTAESTADLQIWFGRVQFMVKPRRFEHVLRVAELARDLALAGGFNHEQAYMAGLLHDVARDLPDNELLRLAQPECEIDLAHPLALHGRAGRGLLERWGFTDPVILEAVEDHTTGPRAGNLISAAVYIADVSEPGRGVNEDIRTLAYQNLSAALRLAIGSKVRYLQGRGICVHPRTLQTFDSLGLF